MSELDFISEVLDLADCFLLLDVNNVYCNSVNHGFDPVDFLRSLPPARVSYIHVAGHYQEAEDLVIDTHGERVPNPVWDLLTEAYRIFGPLPTLLERDSNFPSFAELVAEVAEIKERQRQFGELSSAA